MSGAAHRRGPVMTARKAAAVIVATAACLILSIVIALALLTLIGHGGRWAAAAVGVVTVGGLSWALREINRGLS